MNRASESLKRMMLKLFSLDLPTFSKLEFESSLIDDIIDFARHQHPKEFIALLGGRVNKDVLVIDSLVYQPFQSSQSTSVITMPQPTGARIVGSVHSHPSSNVTPSKADLIFFNKKGAVHLIIGHPYNKDTIACYDSYGNALPFKIRAASEI